MSAIFIINCSTCCYQYFIVAVKRQNLDCDLIMAALCNRGAIIFLPCSFFPSIFFFFFFPRLIPAAAGWMSTIL